MTRAPLNGRGIAARGTSRELLSRVGRLALWLCVAVVLARGLADLPATGQRAVATGVERPAAPLWPDDAARAFAVEFATDYLDHPAGADPGAYAGTVAALASPELADTIAPQLDPHGQAQTVRSAVVAATTRLDGHHALVTVAASVAKGSALRTVRLTVPVSRDADGRLVVDDLPSVAPSPGRAASGPPEGEPLLGDGGAAISDVVTRFLRAYLSGDTAGLAYLVPAGRRIDATGGGFELVEVSSVTALGLRSRAGRVVLAAVRVRDRVSRAVLALRYRLRLVRRDRWYVAEVNGPREG